MSSTENPNEYEWLVRKTDQSRRSWSKSAQLHPSSTSSFSWTLMVSLLYAPVSLDLHLSLWMDKSFVAIAVCSCLRVPAMTKALTPASACNLAARFFS